MKNHTSSKGYSLVEVMIAISILMMAIVAPMTIAFKSIQSSRYALEQNTATFLAQEGISLAEALRSSNTLFQSNGGQGTFWTDGNAFEPCTTQYGCAFDALDPYSLEFGSGDVVECTEEGENCRLFLDHSVSTRSPYRVGGPAGSATPFVRRMFWEYSDLDNNGVNDQIIVRVEVEWDSRFLGQVQSVAVTSTLYNLYRELSI